MKKILFFAFLIFSLPVFNSCKKEIVENNNVAASNAKKVIATIGQSRAFPASSGQILYLTNAIGQVIFSADSYFKVDDSGFIEVGTIQGEKKNYSLANLIFIDNSYPNFPTISLNL